MNFVAGWCFAALEMNLSKADKEYSGSLHSRENPPYSLSGNMSVNIFLLLVIIFSCVWSEEYEISTENYRLARIAKDTRFG